MDTYVSSGRPLGPAYQDSHSVDFTFIFPNNSSASGLQKLTLPCYRGGGGGRGSAAVAVGEQRTNGMLEILPDIEILPGMLEILPDIEILPDARNATVCRNTTKDKRVRFAEPTKQDQVPRVQNDIIPLD